MLGKWGTASGAHLSCTGPTDTGLVGAADLAILLGAWTGSDGFARISFCPCTDQPEPGNSVSMAASGQWDAEAAIGSLGFGSVSAFADWLGSASEAESEAAVAYLVATMSQSTPPTE